MIKQSVLFQVVMIAALITQTTIAVAADESFQLIRNSILRDSPSVRSHAIAELHGGASGSIVQTKDSGKERWYRVVTAKGSTGWLMGSNVRVNGSGITEDAGLKKGASEDNGDIRKIDELSTDMGTALAALKKDNEKILNAMEGLISKKCSYEAKKQVMKISLVSGHAKETAINTLSKSINDLDAEIKRLIGLYKQQNGEIALLSEKIIEAGQNRQALTEMYDVLKVVKPEAPINSGALVTTSASDINKLLQRTSESFGSVGTTVSQTTPTGEDEKDASAQSGYVAPIDNKETINKQVGVVPQWIKDLLSAKGRKINSDDYGSMTVAEDNGLTVMAVATAYNDKFKNAFRKFIKESYQAEGLVYHVIRNKSIEEPASR